MDFFFSCTHTHARADSSPFLQARKHALEHIYKMSFLSFT